MGIFDYFSRRRGRGQDPAHGAQTADQRATAAMLGNQAMLELAARRQRAGAAADGGMDEGELERRMLARLPDGGQEDRAQAAQEMAQVQRQPEMARTTLTELYGQLRSSERGGIHRGGGNSEYYNAVLSALNAVSAAMGGQFTQDAKGNQEKLVKMERLYETLIAACGAYTARNPSTQAGRHRKALVTQIQARASSDLVALGAVRTDFCALPEQEQAGKDWNALLDQSRTVHLSVADLTQMNREKGGQASEVYNLNGTNATLKNAEGDPVPLGDLHFFKPEDELDTSQSTYAGKIVDNVLSRFPKLSKKDRRLIRSWAMSYTGTGAVRELPGLSEDGKVALSAVSSQLSGTKTTSDTILHNLNLNDGSKVNMTKRNVATSRVAALLGLGHLVAKSETAELYDEATGRTLRGNLMEKAAGASSAKEFLKDAKEQAPAAAAGAQKTTSVSVSGGFQRDLCSLQVLDVICGQMDRHSNNFFVTARENGELTGLQGIDNDAAFGRRETVTSSEDGERHDRAVYDIDSGELVLPYMDRELAARIQQLEPDMLRFALKDLLKDEEIEAAVKRLGHTKAAVDKTEREQPERLLADDQWNDDTAQRLIDQAWESDRGFWQDPDVERAKANRGKTLAYENYFGRLMIQSIKGLARFNYGDGDAPQILRRHPRGG